MRRLLACSLAVALLSGCATTSAAQPAPTAIYLPLATNQGNTATPVASPAPQPTPAGTTPVLSYHIVKTYPHDTGAFTQGLLYDGGMLYESTGEYGKSGIRRVDLATGAVQASTLITDTSVWGEGLVLFGDTFYQLTWQSQRGYLYNRDLQQIGTFSYPTEGWGITTDGTRLLMSDGTATIYTLDPVTFAQTPLIQVRDENGPVVRLNELEYVDGALYANIWLTDRIAKIDPASGRVLAYLDLSGLLSDGERANADAVLNGIAYDPVGKRLFVTGKLWPKLFEITIVD